MQSAIKNLVLSVTGAHTIDQSTVIQSLWSGYGQIIRLDLSGGRLSSVIIKHIKLPDVGSHPRGWNTNLSHQRKIRSYQVEVNWYKYYAKYCLSDCIVPICLAVDARENETVMILTDLDADGFDVRKIDVEIENIYACLDWLAGFHATFLNTKADGLWECGTYWHLDTRPDELVALNDFALREAAPLIDRTLRESRYQTFVHGDAKLANFCFRSTNVSSNSSSQVAAVDFQYVGAGCGMKDVAYFIGSCLNENECESKESLLLDYYFSSLADRLLKKNVGIDLTRLEQEWRELYPFAWADFHRFIKGWSPEHWKINRYSERLTASVIRRVQS